MMTGTLRGYKFPNEYELKPLKIDLRTGWITLKLKRKIEKKLR